MVEEGLLVGSGVVWEMVPSEVGVDLDGGWEILEVDMGMCW